MNEPYQNAVALGYCGILLGKCWLTEMTYESLATLSNQDNQELVDALSALEWRVPQPNEALIEALAIDYCQLLIGPKGHLSPVESVWVAQQYQSDTVASMQSFFDLLPDYRAPDSLADHIGVQLDFLGHLLIASGQSVGDGESPLEPPLLFSRTRLGWVSQFTAGVSRQATTEFYSGLARATDLWIEALQFEQANEVA